MRYVNKMQVPLKGMCKAEMCDDIIASIKQQLNSYGCNVKSGRTSFIGQEQNKFKCTYAVCQSM